MGKWDKTEQWHGSNIGSIYYVPGVKDWKHSSRDFPGSLGVVEASPPNAGAMGSIPGQGTKVPHTVVCSQKLEINTGINKYINAAVPS